MREKGQLFLAGEFQLINVKGMRGSTNNTQHSNNSGGQDPLMDAKSREQKCEGKQAGDSAFSLGQPATFK